MAAAHPLPVGTLRPPQTPRDLVATEGGPDTRYDGDEPRRARSRGHPDAHRLSSPRLDPRDSGNASTTTGCTGNPRPGLGGWAGFASGYHLSQASPQPPTAPRRHGDPGAGGFQTTSCDTDSLTVPSRKPPPLPGTLGRTGSPRPHLHPGPPSGSRVFADTVCNGLKANAFWIRGGSESGLGRTAFHGGSRFTGGPSTGSPGRLCRGRRTHNLLTRVHARALPSGGAPPQQPTANHLTSSRTAAVWGRGPWGSQPTRAPAPTAQVPSDPGQGLPELLKSRQPWGGMGLPSQTPRPHNLKVQRVPVSYSVETAKAKDGPEGGPGPAQTQGGDPGGKPTPGAEALHPSHPASCCTKKSPSAPEATALALKRSARQLWPLATTDSNFQKQKWLPGAPTHRRDQTAREEQLCSPRWLYMGTFGSLRSRLPPGTGPARVSLRESPGLGPQARQEESPTSASDLAPSPHTALREAGDTQGALGPQGTYFANDLILTESLARGPGQPPLHESSGDGARSQPLPTGTVRPCGPPQRLAGRRQGSVGSRRRLLRGRAGQRNGCGNGCAAGAQALRMGAVTSLGGGGFPVPLNYRAACGPRAVSYCRSPTPSRFQRQLVTEHRLGVSQHRPGPPAGETWQVLGHWPEPSTYPARGLVVQSRATIARGAACGPALAASPPCPHEQSWPPQPLPLLPPVISPVATVLQLNRAGRGRAEPWARCPGPTAPGKPGPWAPLPALAAVGPTSQGAAPPRPSDEGVVLHGGAVARRLGLHPATPGSAWPGVLPGTEDWLRPCHVLSLCPGPATRLPTESSRAHGPSQARRGHGTSRGSCPGVRLAPRGGGTSAGSLPAKLGAFLWKKERGE
ncbi:collagen alpha-1(I) chain-like [Perognathus longimembris pacificus]|uniref:collagen alpha-1(I) chain-like n=1 Tax=Perognathus longimembris pacificus TaxID=214514 RepID=UPI0020193417|nr:collagen alpha-1(I) chain-like [Perognathus longimembris pacificus]